jgi:hypothetical protein
MYVACTEYPTVLPTLTSALSKHGPDSSELGPGKGNLEWPSEQRRFKRNDDVMLHTPVYFFFFFFWRATEKLGGERLELARCWPC